MKSIAIECPKGLKSRLDNILKPISIKTFESTDKNKSIFEFIGTLENPEKLILETLGQYKEYINVIGVY